MNEIYEFLKQNIEVPIAVLAVFLIIVVTAKARKKYIMQKIRNEFGKFKNYEFKKEYDEENLINTYSILKNQFKGKYIDNITWNDLEMKKFYDKINYTFSDIGSEILYFKLRALDSSKNEDEEIISYFENNEKEREKVSYKFSKLGGRGSSSFIPFLNRDISVKSFEYIRYLIQGMIPLILLITSVFNSIFLFPLIFIVVFNFIYTKTNMDKKSGDIRSINYFASAINTCNKVLKFNFNGNGRLQESYNKVKTLAKGGIYFDNDITSEFGALTYTINSVFMLPFIRYAKIMKNIENHKSDIYNFWYEFGNIEASIAILSLRKIYPYYSIPEFDDNYRINAQEIFHPLIENFVSNDVDFNQNILLTGSNASGKSTYVKSIAISAILAQSINTAFAKSFVMKKGNVLTSMAIKDSIIDGDSYFIAEIKSLKRIIEDIKSGNKSYYFIDEILRGTNTLERISASSSIIDYLDKHKSLSFIATHDLELTKMMEDKVRNIHFKEDIIDNKVVFTYKLQEGPSNTRNAIKLLEVMGFPEDIVEMANKNAKEFVNI